MPVATVRPEIVNCNHGGFYSVTRSGVMLGQVQKMSPHKWAARRHGDYLKESPPVFRSQREAVAHLVAAA